MEMECDFQDFGKCLAIFEIYTKMLIPPTNYVFNQNEYKQVHSPVNQTVVSNQTSDMYFSKNGNNS